jgi:hypothetical protein
VSIGLPPGIFHPPTLPHGRSRRGWLRRLAGRLLPGRFFARPLRRLAWSIVDLQRLPLLNLELVLFRF